jgi:4'-phosphopantetheinyl transferase EntD
MVALAAGVHIEALPARKLTGVVDPWPAGQARATCRDILPEHVLSHELRGAEIGLPYPMVGGEEAFIARAVERRRAQFAAVRYCARQCLAQFGFHDPAVLPDEHGAPQRPAGVKGSMTHVDIYCAAALTNDPGVASVGMDAERHRPLPNGVLDHVSSPAERRLLEGAATAGGLPVDLGTVLFSAKEAVYKAWYPLMRRWLGFHDVHVELDPKALAFQAALLKEPVLVAGSAVMALQGRFTYDSEVVITAIVVPGPG